MDFIDNFKRAWNGKEEFAPPRTKIPVKDVQFNMIPYFDYKDDEVVAKFLESVILSYSTDNTSYEVQVEAIMDKFYANFYKLEMTHYYIKLPGTKYKFWIANEFSNLKLTTGIEDLAHLPFSHRQGARAWFLKRELESIKKKRALDKLNKNIGLGHTAMTSVFSKTAGTINIKQSEVLESLRQTHPEYFV